MTRKISICWASFINHRHEHYGPYNSEGRQEIKYKKLLMDSNDSRPFLCNVILDKSTQKYTR